MEMKRFQWYERDFLCATVYYTGAWPRAQLMSYETHTSDLLDLPLHRNPAAELNSLFENRLEPRHNFSQLSKEYYGVDHYDAELMCRARHGAMPHDTFWMKFESDPATLCWNEVCVQ